MLGRTDRTVRQVVLNDLAVFVEGSRYELGFRDIFRFGLVVVDGASVVLVVVVAGTSCWSR